jgi:hypothetical protein
MMTPSINPGDVLTEALSTNRKGAIAMAAVCIATAAVGGTSLYTSGDTTLAMGLGAGFLLLGLVIGALALRDPRRLPAVRAATERPESIVWVYEERQIVNGVHASTRFQLALRDRRRLAVTVRPPWEARTREALQRALPHAAYGHTPAREEQFERNPASLAAT